MSSREEKSGIQRFDKRYMRKNSRPQNRERRYLFNETTRLIEFVDKKHYNCLLRLLKQLRPLFQDDEEVNDFKLYRLYFDKDKLYMKRQFVFDGIAKFLIDAQSGLIKKQSVFIRYLSTPEHCNLGICEESLKALILEAKRRNY